MIVRAIRLTACFVSQVIVESVADDPDADPKLVAKCATYFLDNGRYDEAARLLVKGGDHARGLELIAEHDVVIDEVRFFLFLHGQLE